MDSEAIGLDAAADRRRRIPVTLKEPATLRALIGMLAEGTYVAEPDGRIIDANPALLKMVGAENVDQLGEHSIDTLWPETERRADFVRQVIERGSVTEFELDVQRLDGGVVTVLDTCQAQKKDGEVVALYGVLLDITQRKTLEAQLGQLSVRDPLTGCYNRRYLRAQQPVLERPSYFYGVLMLDLDDFKAINDTYGHEEGDRVLQRFAHFIIRNKRADDILVRLGGDEFALFVEVVSPENLDIIANRMIENAPHQAPIAFSIGHVYRQPGETLEAILARANAAMYAAVKGRQTKDDARRTAQDDEEE
ncbi:MAG: diguanylate cyclase [Acidobacteria bacterium]|nr:diguanylate cyclase [Acidobacteriota bacterium]